MDVVEIIEKKDFSLYHANITDRVFFFLFVTCAIAFLMLFVMNRASMLGLARLMDERQTLRETFIHDMVAHAEAYATAIIEALLIVGRVLF